MDRLNYVKGDGPRRMYRIPGTIRYVSRQYISKYLDEIGLTLEDYYCTYINPRKKNMYGYINYPKCSVCGKRLTFYKLSNPYPPKGYCSKSCKMKDLQRFNYHNSPYRTDESRRKKSNSLKLAWKNKDSKFNTKEYHEIRSELSKIRMNRLYSDPNSIFNSEDFKSTRLFGGPKKRLENLKNIMKYSKISFDLFSNLETIIRSLDPDVGHIFYGENEYFVSKNLKYIDNKCSIRFLDFYIPKYNKCIEFYGDYWHPRDPNRSEDSIKSFINDLNRSIFLKCNGINDILVIKEHEYRSSKDLVINKCVNFIISYKSSRVEISEKDQLLYYGSEVIDCRTNENFIFI